MNTTQQVPCNCTTCTGTGCTGCTRCICQQAAAQTTCTCSPQCPCGAQCQCGAGTNGAQA
jgi:hypothetical protein